MIAFVVNGRKHELEVGPETPLLYVLRNDLGLNGPKFGCGLGQCGACTVLVDGAAVLSCVTPIGQAAGRSILTLEGLGTPERPHPLQRAFIEEQAAQCGFCANGMILRSKALLDRTPRSRSGRPSPATSAAAAPTARFCALSGAPPGR